MEKTSHGSQYMKRHSLKFILCIIVSLVIDFIFLYTEFWYIIYWGSNDTFFGIFAIPNEIIGIILFIFTIIIAELVVVLACKLLKLTPKEKKVFFIINSILIIGFLVFWLWQWIVVYNIDRYITNIDN